MNTAGHTAVVDIGKTNIKLCVVDAAGTTLISRACPNETVDGPPFPHFDLDGIWHWLLAALRSAATELPIGAIVPAAHGAACALVDAQDGLLLPVLDYEYTGIEEVSPEYEPLARNFADTLSPRLPVGHNLGRQLFWLRHRFPDEFARTRYILTHPQYWSWRLSGVPAAEVTLLGCHSDLWKPDDDTFSDFAREMGWDRMFPPLQPAWARLGSVRPEVAAATGLRRDCAVHNGIHDSNASYLRHLVSRADGIFSVVSTGTWVICFAAGRPTDRLDADRGMLAYVDVNGSPVASSRFMGGREFVAIAGSLDQDTRSGPDDVRTIIERQIFALPAFAQQGGPFQGQTGRIVGPATGDQRERMALAALYCALIVDCCLSLIDGRGDVIIEGVFTRNRLFCGLLAALRRPQPTFVSDDPTGTVVGAAMLTRWPPANAEVSLRPCQPMGTDGLDLYKQRWHSLVGPDLHTS